MTRGKGEIKPTRYLNDVHTQVWLERRALATIGLYMDNNEVPFTALVHIIRFSLETTVEMIRRSGGHIFEDTGSASSYLSARVGTNLHTDGKAKKNLINNLLLDSMGNEVTDSVREYMETQKENAPKEKPEILFTEPKEEPKKETISPDENIVRGSGGISKEELSAIKQKTFENCTNIIDRREAKDSKQLNDIAEAFSKKPEEV
jgi:hypothetical protein